MDYKHIISLGSTCAIATNLEKLGFRDCSSPFDWCISDFNGVLDCINNNFDGFVDYDKLCQNNDARGIYKNQYDIQFFHDFNKYEPLSNQIKEVQLKYQRRIERFYQNIVEPTVFIRYISRVNTYEMLYIENHFNEIQSLFKSYNSANEIVFISNDDVRSNKFKIYYVTPDADDVIARFPINKNKELLNYVNSLNIPNREENLLKYKKKEKQKQKNKLKSEIIKKTQALFKKEYIHSKHY